MVRRISAVIVIAGFVAAASGCLIVRGSSVDEAGTKISSPTLSQIQTGETTEAWLVATVGEPTRRSAVNERISILRYDHTVTMQKGGGRVSSVRRGRSNGTDNIDNLRSDRWRSDAVLD